MTRYILRLLIRMGCLAVLLILPAKATIIEVTALSDAIAVDGRCTLREAVIAANTDAAVNECPAGSGADTVVLAFSSTFTLSIPGTEDAGLSGDLDVLDDLTIRPANADEMPTIDAMGIDRVFDVLSGADLTLDHIEVRNGDVAGFGGGIFVRDGNSQLELVGSVVAGNRASSFGGGIFSRGPVRLRRSSVHANDGSFGGGILISTSAQLTLVDSSIWGNVATSDGGGLSLRALRASNSSIWGNDAVRHGGGIHWRGDTPDSDLSQLINTTVAENGSGEDGGGLYVEGMGTVELYNVTVAWNTADFDEDGLGDSGGLGIAGGTVRAQGSIVAANRDLSPTSTAPDCRGDLESMGYNLLASIDPAECVITGITTGDLVGTLTDPIAAELNCLAPNGGPTPSVEPMETSPVIDAGNPQGCADGSNGILQQDQRGHARPWDGPDGDPDARCDMGSVEFAAPVFNRIFADGFESGDSTAWGQGGGNPPFSARRFSKNREKPALPLGSWRHLKGGGCDPR